jgi:dienelactone hydrolase
VFLFCQTCIAQTTVKPTIDFSAIENWPSLDYNVGISDEGDYFFYVVNNMPQDNCTMTVESIDGIWKKEIVGASDGFFSSDNKRFVFYYKDTLHLLGLGSNVDNFICNVSFFKSASLRNVIAYKLKDDDSTLHIFDLTKSFLSKISSVDDFFFNQNTSLLITSRRSQGDSLIYDLLSFDYSNLKIDSLWTLSEQRNKDFSITNLVFDRDGTGVAFKVEKPRKENCAEIWYYNFLSKTSKLLFSQNAFAKSSPSNWLIDGYRLSKNGKFLFVQLNEQSNPDKGRTNYVSMDVWNYKDVKLQAEQLMKPEDTRSLTMSINVISGKMLLINENGEKIDNDDNEDHLILNGNESKEALWWNYIPNTYYLYSLVSGSKQKFVTGTSLYAFSFSPNGRYIVYFNGNSNAYMSYDIKNRVTHNISHSIPANFRDKNSANPKSSFPVGPAGWLQDNTILVYDNYDIWKIDPENKIKPINITNVKSSRNYNTQFRLAHAYQGSDLVDEDDMLLVGFSPSTKYNGFYKVTIKQNTLDSLSMGPYLLDHQVPISFSQEADKGMTPIKAKNNNTWLVKRQDNQHAPNLFLTTDFINYRAITNLEPQKHYNWLKADLVSFKTSDGKVLQGVLYKPENLNPLKEYPVIINYYEQLSHRLYSFLKPDYCRDNIDIPWFVSRGFAVFTPDIDFTWGASSGKINGENACKAIVGAYNHLLKIPWIDSKHIGIQGHSFGGQLTNYIITHSNDFAAAVEAAGTSDLVSTYLILAWPLANNGTDRQRITEIGQGRMGGSLWEQPELYLKASPVLNADEIKSPLLIMHNKKDQLVPWSQGLEMFMALRRLNKKVWMLQYDNGGHNVAGEEAKDYTIRLTQYFDHYLKSAPAPVWMTRGIPARLKQVITGYDFDPENSCGKDCKVCKMWNEKMKKDSAGTMKEIVEKIKTEHWIGDGIGN